ncbi:MAG: hypothetical protein IKG67_01580 [Parasporobacterium sp.]|nr:hypothetical protein [Parasporobacterium sp.]
MKTRKRFANFIKTIILPVFVFVLFFILTRAQGIMYYGTANMWMTILRTVCYTLTVSFGIAVQIRAGRMDFTGGITFILASMLSGMVTVNAGGNSWMLLGISVLAGVLISVITATVYIVARLPIVICTIGMALLYESLTTIVGRNGYDLQHIDNLTYFGRVPGIIMAAVFVMILYFVYTNYTVCGYQTRHLRNNQLAAINIGINEKKNIYVAYIISGVIFGIAGVIYCTQTRLDVQSNLSTVGPLFSNLVIVYMGFYFGTFSTDTIGVFVASLSVALFNYGMSAIGLDNGLDKILYAFFFMILINIITENAWRIKALFQKKKQQPDM